MYGFYGLVGIFVSNLIIVLVIYSIFFIVKKDNIKNYSEFINYLVGQNKFINYTINNIMNVFLFVSFIVIVSGFGAYFKQEFNIPIIYGAVLVSILAMTTFYKDLDGIIKINSFLIPCLIFLIILLGLKVDVFSFKPNSLIIYSNQSWFFQAILYACYNSIVLIPIVINLNSFIENKKQISFISFLTFIFMSVMSVIIYIILCINSPEINFIDIPIVYIANKLRYIL